jgi:uncharacterized OB-fold protein
MSGDWTTGTPAILYERCAACGTVSYFRRGFCPSCGSPDVRCERSAGEGRLHAITHVSRAPTPELRALAPYAILLVDMAEGFRMMAHGEPTLAIDDPVRAGFRSFGDRLVPYFERTP